MNMCIIPTFFTSVWTLCLSFSSDLMQPRSQRASSLFDVFTQNKYDRKRCLPRTHVMFSGLYFFFFFFFFFFFLYCIFSLMTSKSNKRIKKELSKQSKQFFITFLFFGSKDWVSKLNLRLVLVTAWINPWRF